MRRLLIGLLACFALGLTQAADSTDRSPLAGTQPLTLNGDIASNLVAGVDRFLLREIEESQAGRARHWVRDFSSPEAYRRSIEPNRQRLAHLLGVRDARPAVTTPQWLATVEQPALVGRGPGYEIFSVRWPALDGVFAEGLLLKPTTEPVADLIAIPDAEQTPEQLCGLQDGIPSESQYARRLAENGCRILIPTIINRNFGPHLGRGKMTAREFLYRPAFELGRQLIGFEIQKVLAGVDWYAKSSPADTRPIGVIGWGEGGLLALYAGALDPRIQAVCVSGYFDDRRHVWEEPLDRNIFGLLEQFGDAEIASLIAPRSLIVEAARGPEVTISGQGGGGPSRLVTPAIETVKQEIERAHRLVDGLNLATFPKLVISGSGKGPFGSEPALESFLRALLPNHALAGPRGVPQSVRTLDNPARRQERQLAEINQFTQRLLIESPEVRREFMKNLDTKTPEAYARTSESYRKIFREEVVGHFADPVLPANPRTRRSYETGKWIGYEVLLDVFPDVIAYGVLLVPRDVKSGERRPVVVCQHGLEGRPQDVIMGDKEAYHDFAAKLADRGFITFSPQNLYIFTDRFRTLQRKSNALKKTLFSTIVPQHQQIVDWLETLPFVDPARIGFYGLSYGGKSAMRIPPLVPEYVLSICSADFNEWVGKNAATAGTMGRYSYTWSGEYEIFEWDLGSTFNYAEMAALIAPRPFMVERGHFDGVAPDESVAWEFGKVKFHYAARLGLGDRCEMETFVGPHTIHGKGTYDFLHQHLNWPKR